MKFRKQLMRERKIELQEKEQSEMNKDPRIKALANLNRKEFEALTAKDKSMKMFKALKALLRQVSEA